jgi:MFS family permease
VVGASEILFAARSIRTFSYGSLSLVLALYLSGKGFSAAQIGLVFTATLVEDAIFTALVASLAERVGPRRVLVLSAILLSLGGAALALAQAPALIAVIAILGTLSPSGQEAGPFTALEQALLPDAVAPDRRTRAFAWYSVFGFLPAALGALAAGGWRRWARGAGLAPADADRCLLWVFAGSGLLLALLYSRLPSRRTAARTAEKTPSRAFGLHRSRRVVFELSALQAVDALAGGFIVQALLVYWFHLRFGVGPEELGPLFFGTNVLSALSFFVAARAAERFGLLRTMVFSHLPSNVLLLLVPLAGSFPLAAALLLARHLLSQMDVPTRQAYTMALVAPDERAAAAGFTTSARGLAQAVAPTFTGLALGAAATGIPFLLAGGLKILYDLALYFRFRGVPLTGHR